MNFQNKKTASAMPGTASPLLVCFSHLRWDFVYQRPQHLLSRAASTYSVVFVEEPVFNDVEKAHLDVRTSESGVTIAVPVLPHGLTHDAFIQHQRDLIDAFLEQYAQPFLIYWYYTPAALAFTDPARADVIVYDNMDELSAFLGAPPELIAFERDLLSTADVVFTGGRSLYEAKRDRHPNVHAFPSSIDAPHFMVARQDLDTPQDQAFIPGPRIGFFGVIDERMDMGLVEAMAQLRPDWQFVMIGPVVKIDPATMPRKPNTHWLGGKSYGDLPQYLSGWDVGFMPFALNESTRFISPTKTPEFLAAGVPVVSTPITDVIRPYGELGLVEIARTAEEAVHAIDRILARPRKEWLQKVDDLLGTMSWDKTWAAMNDEIERAFEASRPQLAVG